LVFLDEKFSAILFFVYSWIKILLLKPLKTFLCGRTLRIISIAEFFDIELYSLFKSKAKSKASLKDDKETQ